MVSQFGYERGGNIENYLSVKHFFSRNNITNTGLLLNVHILHETK